MYNVVSIQEKSSEAGLRFQEKVGAKKRGLLWDYQRDVFPDFSY